MKRIVLSLNLNTKSEKKKLNFIFTLYFVCQSNIQTFFKIIALLIFVITFRIVFFFLLVLVNFFFSINLPLFPLD